MTHWTIFDLRYCTFQYSRVLCLFFFFLKSISNLQKLFKPLHVHFLFLLLFPAAIVRRYESLD